MPLQQLAEESFGGFLITARLDEDIDYITILVYRAPEVLAFTLYLYEDQRRGLETDLRCG